MQAVCLKQQRVYFVDFLLVNALVKLLSRLQEMG